MRGLLLFGACGTVNATALTETAACRFAPPSFC